MERLTERNSMGVAVYKIPYACGNCNEELYRLPDYGNGSPTDKLAEYEYAEEQGLLLKLPVFIGNIVYRINEYADKPIIPMGVTSIEIKGITDTFKELKCKECVFGGEFKYRFSDIGKTVFLTKEEAEQALKRMESE